MHYLDLGILPILTLLPLLIAVAFFTLAERKVMASIQRRRGPAVIGLFGVLQPFADALKLILKELIVPTKAHSAPFLLAPFLVLFFSLLNWVALPFSFNSILIDLEYSLLYFLVISSLGVYGIFLSG